MKLGDWLDERTHHRAALARWLDHPLAGGASWAVAIGGALAITFGVLAITGALLLTVYAPTTQAAWASVHFISRSLAGGWLVRGVHHYASHAMLVLVGAHVVHVVAVGAYKRPREVWFWLGLALGGLLLAAAITGHALPWDQKGYWARKVESGIIGMAPGIGPWVQRMFGVPDLGTLRLARMHALHVAILPTLLMAIFAVRTWVARRAPATGSAPEPYSKQLARDLVVALAVLATCTLLAWRAHGAPLDAPADPSSDYPARPEWFLMALFRLRKFFTGSGEFWGTAALPGAVALYVAALPLLDRKPNVSLGVRAPALAPAALAAAGAIALHVVAVRHDANDAEYAKQHAKADAQAALADRAAMAGVPPSGPLDMPELRGKKLFETSCASCHVLEDLGDPKKANAARLDGWGTEAWLVGMMHDPDAAERFGRTPYKETMPPVDVATKDKKAMATRAEMEAAALFLAAQGDEPDEPRAADPAKLQLGATIVKERCTTCHLFEGKGDDDGSGTAPELARYGSIAWTRAQIANPTSATTYRDKAIDEPGNKGHMPRFDAEMSAADIDLVARWTRAHARLGKVSPK